MYIEAEKVTKEAACLSLLIAFNKIIKIHIFLKKSKISVSYYLKKIDKP